MRLMSANLPLIFLAFLGGAVLPLQMGVNGSLRQGLGHPMQATFVSFAVGSIAALMACLLMRTPMPTADRIAQPALWMWLGGCFGVFYVFTTIVSGPRIGAALAVSLAIAGQLIIATMLDHTGSLGFPQHSISPMKLAGIGLVIAGVLVVSYSKQA
jgi:bacterial/archaeal transporter family-2 protein